MVASYSGGLLQNEDVAEAMEGLDELGDIGNQSVREIAKLTDSDQVSVKL